MRRIELFVAGLLLSVSGALHAETQVQVVGLFPDAAVLLVDGQRKLVRTGQIGPGGVRVVSANSKGAVLDVDGAQRTYTLSREYRQTPGEAPRKIQVSIAKAGNGHFWTAGSINGFPVQFLVDTGATSIAMNENQARRLGIDYRVRGQQMVANTAAGSVNAWHIRLDSVKVGGIEVLNVEAAVIEGDSPADVLLGMSFLNFVRWREDNGVLLLESKT